LLNYLVKLKILKSMSFYPQIECNVTLKKESTGSKYLWHYSRYFCSSSCTENIQHIYEITIYNIQKFMENVHMYKTVKCKHWLPWQHITLTSTITVIHSTAQQLTLVSDHIASNASEIGARCGLFLFLCMSWWCVCVCLCVGHVREPSKNGWTDQDVVWLNGGTYTWVPLVNKIVMAKNS